RAYAAAREAAAREPTPSQARSQAAAPGGGGERGEELAGVLRGWPVREIERDVRLSSPQRVAFYELVTASLKAADTLGGACPAESALTPVGRMDAMRKRLAAVRAATAAIRPALAHFPTPERSGDPSALRAGAGRPAPPGTTRVVYRAVCATPVPRNSASSSRRPLNPLTPTLSPLRGERERTECASPSQPQSPHPSRRPVLPPKPLVLPGKPASGDAHDLLRVGDGGADHLCYAAVSFEDRKRALGGGGVDHVAEA